MSLYPTYTNFIGLNVAAGEGLVFDLVLLDDSGALMPFSFLDPGGAGTLTWVFTLRVQDIYSRAWLEYQIDDGLYIVDPNKSQIRITIPPVVLKGPRGYRWYLIGYTDNLDASHAMVHARGYISVRNASFGSIDQSAV